MNDRPVSCKKKEDGGMGGMGGRRSNTACSHSSPKRKNPNVERRGKGEPIFEIRSVRTPPEPRP